jgi:hypothetical protein
MVEALVENVYTRNGYKNRAEYLESLGAEYSIDDWTVTCLADMLGESEDFDGLIVALDDYSDMLDWGE